MTLPIVVSTPDIYHWCSVMSSGVIGYCFPIIGYLSLSCFTSYNLKGAVLYKYCL